MKYAVSFFLLIGFVCLGFAQQKEELFFETFNSQDFDYITINSSYGDIYIQPSHDQLGARVEFIFTKDKAVKALNLMEYISVKHITNDTGIILTTVFDEKLFLKNNTLWELKDDINIEFRVKVPAHVSVQINHKHGRVHTGQISNPIGMKLDNASLISKFSDDLTVEGSDFRVDVSAVKSLKVKGSQGHLTLADISACDLDLTYCTVESFGFENLKAEVEQVAMSIGKTNNCDITASMSTIEFTDLVEKGNFNLTDVQCVIQKLPNEFKLQSTRGNAKFNLHRERNIRIYLEAVDSDLELGLRGGTIRMTQVNKKTATIIPEGGTLTKKSAEFVQRGSHGATINAQMTRGQIVIKK